MTKLIMERNSADNKYFHPDFHIVLDRGIRYLGEHFGHGKVKEFLSGFTKMYYGPLIKNINEGGLIHLKNHLESIYKVENASDALQVSTEDNRLDVQILYCPAVKYMRSVSYTPCVWYYETTDTVNRVLASESGYLFELHEYDDATGRARYSYRKEF